MLQKKAIRVISNSHYIAHTGPICKRLHMLKVSDMFRLAIWKIYYKLMNNKLPSYFNYMKPNLPVICNYSGIRKPKFHLPIIRHVFAEQLIQYNLIKIINDDIKSVGIMDVVLTQSFCAFKSNINPIRSGLFQTVNDPGGALKAPPPPYDLENYYVNRHHIIHVNFTRCFRHDPIRIFQKFVILTILQRFRNKK